MSDPYGVLGITPNATDDEVKRAYRELARKYHPDNYHDNPLADLAQEKMKEINEAYDGIMKAREGGGTYKSGYGGTGTGSGSGATGGGANSETARVRAAINAGNLQLAEELLRGFSNTSAEWHFLMGSVCYRKGWLDDALGHYHAAVSLEPNNPEYRQALMLMNRGGVGYRPRGGGGLSTGGCDMCDVCTALMCMNMCCRCG